jgi:hypothetical protein
VVDLWIAVQNDIWERIRKVKPPFALAGLPYMIGLQCRDRVKAKFEEGEDLMQDTYAEQGQFAGGTNVEAWLFKDTDSIWRADVNQPGHQPVEPGDPDDDPADPPQQPQAPAQPPQVPVEPAENPDPEEGAGEDGDGDGDSDGNEGGDAGGEDDDPNEGGTD